MTARRRPPDPAERVPKFYCGFCERQTASRVLETRGVRRRRACLDCGRRFTTRERVQKGRKEPMRRPDRLTP